MNQMPACQSAGQVAALTERETRVEYAPPFPRVFSQLPEAS